MRQCPRCSGSGVCIECEGKGEVPCSACKGTGEVTVMLPTGIASSRNCTVCDGRGLIDCNKTCEVCSGKGYLDANSPTAMHRLSKPVAPVLFHRQPVASYILLGLIFLITLASGALWGKRNFIFFIGVFYGPLIEAGQVWRFVTAMFLHADFVHLLCNFWSLYVLCPLIERIIGSGKFLILYFLSGIAGYVLSMIMMPDIPSVGASGALFGVMTSYLGLNLRQPIFPKQIIYQMLFWLGLNVVISLTSPSINIWAHLGGAAAGFIYSSTISLVDRHR